MTATTAHAPSALLAPGTAAPDFTLPATPDHPLLTGFLQGTYEEIPDIFV